MLVDVFLVVYQLGICCCYIVFVGVNLKDVLDVYLSEPISVEITMLICLIPFILINMIRNLKLLAPFSSLANVLTFVSFGIILYYIFKGGLPEFSSLPSFGSLYTFPLFFGTTLFALEAVGVVSIQMPCLTYYSFREALLTFLQLPFFRFFSPK